jgi:ankyrin repeat protein
LIDRGADKDLPGDYADYSGNVFSGYTPLMAAAQSRNVEGVKTLLAKKVNFDYRDPASKLTALGVAKAAGGGNQDVIDILTAWGAHE